MSLKLASICQHDLERYKQHYSSLTTPKTFGMNDKNFSSELVMTGVLHTHTRRLDIHPLDCTRWRYQYQSL